jgi:FkbM family methyltransferase
MARMRLPIDGHGLAFLRARTKNRALHLLHRLGLRRFREELVEVEGGYRIAVRAGTQDAGIVHEVWTTRAYPLERVDVRPGDVVVDAGAQIGVFTLLAARTPARIIALEPAPMNLALLQSNLARNGLAERVEVHGIALGPEGSARANLYLSYTNTGGASIVGRIGPRVSVESLSIAALFERFGIERCRVLKLDVEAGEYPILYSSSKETLARIDHLFVEAESHPLMPAPERPSWPPYTPAALTGFLARHGFAVERVPNAYTLHARRAEPAR